MADQGGTSLQDKQLYIHTYTTIETGIASLFSGFTLNWIFGYISWLVSNTSYDCFIAIFEFFIPENTMVQNVLTNLMNKLLIINE